MAAHHKLYRFQQLEIWQRAADVSTPLGLVADRLAERRLPPYAKRDFLLFRLTG
jgi:hypothetical protein